MKYLVLLIFSFSLSFLYGQKRAFSKKDTIRGSYSSERSWWDLTYYDLYVEVYPDDKRLEGHNTIRYRVVSSDQKIMQIDLQDPLKVYKITQDGVELEYEKIFSSYMVELIDRQRKGEMREIKVFYGGHPTESENPPWSGGITWDKDSIGNWFLANSNQGVGASIWWPCKDHPADEVDSMLISINTPAGLQDVSNGRLRSVTDSQNGRKTYHWFVLNPINNYGVNFNIGDFAHFSEQFQGEKGTLDCNYYVLKYNLEKAREQFRQVPKMLEAFEYWLGPYPFYEDGYKLVEAPYLGMEHQSSVTYGNHFSNGYLGRDLSHTGWGLKFDFIIIHESAHEWFANSITYADVADMWIHESFTAYCESLYLEYHFGKEAGDEYIRGTRASIANECPIQGKYAVYDEGCSGTDMYYKGANMIHTLRQIVDQNDPEADSKNSKWRKILRGLNKTFYHQTVLASDIEGYLNDHIDQELGPFFDQYLRDTRLPVFTYWMVDNQLRYRFDNVVDGFVMPLRIWVDGEALWLDKVSGEWQNMILPKGLVAADVKVDPDFYVAVLSIGN